MKNKSKLNKIRQLKSKKIMVPKEWFYMNPNPISVKEIGDCFEEHETVVPQVWRELGILELEIPEQKSIDMETLEVDLCDEYSNEFLAQHGVQALFGVIIDPENFEQVQELMKVITSKLGGMFCGDTDEFTPQVK